MVKKKEESDECDDQNKRKIPVMKNEVKKIVMKTFVTKIKNKKKG